MCGDPEVGEYPGRVTEVDWKRAVDCELKMHGVWLSSVFNLVLLLFVLAASYVRWYVLLVVWHCWKGLSRSNGKTHVLQVLLAHLGNWTMFALLIRWHCYAVFVLRRGYGVQICTYLGVHICQVV